MVKGISEAELILDAHRDRYHQCDQSETCDVVSYARSLPGSHPNPMNSRCGEEGCDCGYVIEKQTAALKGAVNIISGFPRARFGDYWLPNWLAGARYAIHLAEEGQR